MPIITTPRHLQEGPTEKGLPNYYPTPQQKPGISPPPDAGLGFIEAIPDTQDCLHCGRSFFYTGRRPVCLDCRIAGKS